MSRAPAIMRVVDGGDLPEYPLEASSRSIFMPFLMFYHDRWLNSDLRTMASMEVQGCALNLFFIAQKQSPLGTLPNNDELLAAYLKLDLRRWRELRALEFNPLHKWHPCRCGDEIRLMHPVVTEVAVYASTRSEQRVVSGASAAVRTRLRRMREALAGLGCGPAVLKDDVLMERMDQWMVEHVKGQRRSGGYQRALEHAAAQKWFGGVVNDLR